MKLSSSIFLLACTEANSRERRSHTIGGGTYAGTTYTGSYLRGVTVSISGAEPNPDTGALRVNVKQTYSWRRDLAGYGADGCTEFHVLRNKKSNKIGPVDKLNSGKYHKAMAYFQEDRADSLATMMDRWGPYDDWSTRVGDTKNTLDWKINYYVKKFQDKHAFKHDNWCMGEMEDVLESAEKVSNPTSFMFRNRIEGGTNWMVIVADNDERTVNFGTRGGAAVYEKYKFGAAMFDVNPRADTGEMNNSPVADLPEDFTMKANCKTSLKVNVSDPDGDRIKCRFAFGDETSELIAHTRDVRGEMISDFPSITLDGETCTVTYDGVKDNICTGDPNQVFEHRSSRPDVMKYAGANHCHKPFALIAEDFDSDGNVLSSIPITFFGRVVDGECNDDSFAIKVPEIEAVLENIISEHKDPGNNLNGRRANRINIMARLLERFTTKSCGSGLTKDVVEDFKTKTSGVREAGLKLLSDALVGCKSTLEPKASKKWEKAMDKLEQLDAKIDEKNAN